MYRDGWVDGEVEGRKNISYLSLYGVRHMVKDHSDSEKGNPLPPHGLLFPERCGWIVRWRGGWEKRMGR